MCGAVDCVACSGVREVGACVDCSALEREPGEFAECDKCEKPVCDQCAHDGLCPNCTQNRAEAANERAFTRHWEGSDGPTLAELQESGRQIKDGKLRA
jgi:hypothetical protein